MSIAIKYRGKALATVPETCKEGDWVYGYLVKAQRKYTYYILGDIVESELDSVSPEFWVEVDIATIGMDTGIDDKKGNRIYVGDIVKMKGLYGEEGSKYEAYYQAGFTEDKGFYLFLVKRIEPVEDYITKIWYFSDFRPFWKNKESLRLELKPTFLTDSLYNRRWIGYHYTEDIEIIGNIHDNSNLLK